MSLPRGPRSLRAVRLPLCLINLTTLVGTPGLYLMENGTMPESIEA